MKNKEKQKTNGITLIALVITIIVLLILAGVTIAALTGDNGVLRRASEASEKTEIANEQEKVRLSAMGAITKNNGEKIIRTNLNEELTNNIGKEGIDYTLSESETAPFVVTYSNSGRSYLIDENGNVSEYVDISKYIKVGDYINYNPTIVDKSGTQVELSKLTYTSLKGTGTSHGNGSGNQAFTASADIKWRVFSIGNGIVQLISENAITTDEGTNFTMNSAIGYLYAEQELHEICKIYGYGYGADTSQVTEYSYGGPLDGDLTGKIIGSGARSITAKDINKKAGIYEDENGILRFSDGTAVNTLYGNTTNPTMDIHYPTINTMEGKSESIGARNLKYTDYNYNKSKVEDIDMQDILFNGNYWLASRCITSNYYVAQYRVSYIDSNQFDNAYLYTGNNSTDFEYSYNDYAVRPIVILKSNVIDTNSSTEYNGKTMWNLK